MLPLYLISYTSKLTRAALGAAAGGGPAGTLQGSNSHSRVCASKSSIKTDPPQVLGPRVCVIKTGTLQVLNSRGCVCVRVIKTGTVPVLSSREVKRWCADLAGLRTSAVPVGGAA